VWYCYTQTNLRRLLEYGELYTKTWKKGKKIMHRCMRRGFWSERKADAAFAGRHTWQMQNIGVPCG